MPQYCWKCAACGHRLENQVREYQVCLECGTPMGRDYGAERAISTFHPTVDVYANSKKGK